MPNTFDMQETALMAVDHYIDSKKNGLSVDCPMIFTIPKGTLPCAKRILDTNVKKERLYPTRLR